jgi:hypothetical protein
VAGLVAILSRVSPTDPIPAFRSALVMVIAFFAAGGVVSAALLTARLRPVPAVPAVLVRTAAPADVAAGVAELQPACQAAPLTEP